MEKLPHSEAFPAIVRALDALLNAWVLTAATDEAQNEQLRRKLAIKRQLAALPDCDVETAARRVMAGLVKVA